MRWKNLCFNISIALNCLLVFLLLFENRIAVPAWLQVAGRMHPLILHFPLVLILLYALFTLVPSGQKISNTEHGRLIADVLLLAASFTAALTAVFGLLLSREAGYDAAALQWHKWGGAAVSIFTLTWYYFRRSAQTKKAISFLTASLAIILVIFTGHQGATITHGQQFLLAPLLPEEKERSIDPEQAIVYQDMVKPILEKKCMSCHNRQKAKGEFIMETEALLLRGGKSGIPWDASMPDHGLLLTRLYLPAEEKKHMPPQGKPALSAEELAIITQWVRKGADFKLRVADLPDTDTLKQIAKQLFSEQVKVEYAFDKADPSVIKELNSVNRVVTEEAQGSPALSVSFFNSQLFNSSQLKELTKIKKQVVSLDLSKMDVKDEDMKVIGELENLRILNLGFTNITGASLPTLKKLKFLETLSLAGTKLTAAQLKELQGFPQLKTVYTWNTGISAKELDQLVGTIKNIRWETGFNGDTVHLKLSPPLIANENMIIKDPVPLQLKHYIKGTGIRYTTDGSEPDSLHSPVFNNDFLISSNTFIRAKAYKAGWVSSDIIEQNFYTSKYIPDSILFITQPDPSHKGESRLLADLQKGETNFRSDKWLAWRQTRTELLLEYKNPVSIESITLSSLVDVNSYIMPPAMIEVWGGNDPKSLKLLSKKVPDQPVKVQPAALRGYECKFAPASVRFIKLVASPVFKLPAWHPGKGDKAWLFIDEIMVN